MYLPQVNPPSKVVHWLFTLASKPCQRYIAQGIKINSYPQMEEEEFPQMPIALEANTGAYQE